MDATKSQKMINPQRTLLRQIQKSTAFVLKMRNSSRVEKVGQDIDFGNNGKTLSEVGEKQQRRKLKDLKQMFQKALWFAERHLV